IDNDACDSSPVFLLPTACCLLLVSPYPTDCGKSSCLLPPSFWPLRISLPADARGLYGSSSVARKSVRASLSACPHPCPCPRTTRVASASLHEKAARRCLRRLSELLRSKDR